MESLAAYGNGTGLVKHYSDSKGNTKSNAGTVKKKKKCKSKKRGK